jgi:ppGpp synthetase/RelA/SpoT-type nucleotidyltranferase
VTRRSTQKIEAAYAARSGLLSELADKLEEELRSLLSGVSHVDRVSFRTKSITSFVEKANDLGEAGRPKYAHPLEEIEDQVAGRILVFFRSDIAAVLDAIEGNWRKAEQRHKKPARTSQFDYETTHTVCLITPDMWPEGWSALENPPTTFELQIRTLAQHAWSEPQHGFYKRGSGLPESSERKMYWAAASAWGIDSIWEDIKTELDKLDTEH